MLEPKPPLLHTRRRNDGSWYVDVTWPNSRNEKMGNFQTSADAEEFIKGQMQAWNEGNRKFASRAQ